MSYSEDRADSRSMTAVFIVVAAIVVAVIVGFLIYNSRQPAPVVVSPDRTIVVPGATPAPAPSNPTVIVTPGAPGPAGAQGAQGAQGAAGAAGSQGSQGQQGESGATTATGETTGGTG